MSPAPKIPDEPEIRSPKSQIRNPCERTSIDTAQRHRTACDCPFGFRDSFGFRHSDFGFAASPRYIYIVNAERVVFLRGFWPRVYSALAESGNRLSARAGYIAASPR